MQGPNLCARCRMGSWMYDNRGNYHSQSLHYRMYKFVNGLYSLCSQFQVITCTVLILLHVIILILVFIIFLVVILFALACRRTTILFLARTAVIIVDYN